MPFAKRTEEGVPEDTEGNMPLKRGVEDGSESESDDTEGQGIRPKIVKDGEAESNDTEGNMSRGKG